MNDLVVKVDRLKEKITEHNISQENVAKKIGINRATFYRKMKNGGEGFTVGEIHKLVDTIPLTKEEAIDIFFAS